MNINTTELNKLFCTFSTLENIDNTIKTISKTYSIVFNKIYILESPQSTELICTYNVDTGNMGSIIMNNTITLHRKKESNTLYTVNALNSLIRSLNEGKLDTSYQVDWQNYRNTVLLTHKSSELRRLDTKLFKIIDLTVL